MPNANFCYIRTFVYGKNEWRQSTIDWNTYHIEKANGDQKSPYWPMLTKIGTFGQTTAFKNPIGLAILVSVKMPIVKSLFILVGFLQILWTTGRMISGELFGWSGDETHLFCLTKENKAYCWLLWLLAEWYSPSIVSSLCPQCCRHWIIGVTFSLSFYVGHTVDYRMSLVE